MKQMKQEELRYAKDYFFPLPGTLIVQRYQLDCLIHLGEKGIKQIAEESKKKDPMRPLYLNLFTKRKDSDECPHEFDYQTLDWDKVVEFKISGNTSDIWDNRNRTSIQYISVVIITEM